MKMIMNCIPVDNICKHMTNADNMVAITFTSFANSLRTSEAYLRQ